MTSITDFGLTLHRFRHAPHAVRQGAPVTLFVDSATRTSGSRVERRIIGSQRVPDRQRLAGSTVVASPRRASRSVPARRIDGVRRRPSPGRKRHRRGRGAGSHRARRARISDHGPRRRSAGRRSARPRGGKRPTSSATSTAGAAARQLGPRGERADRDDAQPRTSFLFENREWLSLTSTAAGAARSSSSST